MAAIERRAGAARRCVRVVMFRAALRAVAVYLLALAVLCMVVRWMTSVHEPLHREVLASVWKAGELIDRSVYLEGQRRDPRLDRVAGNSAEVVLETVVDESPIVA